MAKATKSYTFDKELYVKEGSQYFAIAYSKNIGTNIILCIDKDTDEFVYAFAKVCNYFYVDATGGFWDVREHLNYLNIKNVELVECGIKEAEEMLKKKKVYFTNVEIKRNAREFVRNNLVLFDIQIDDIVHTMGLCGIHFIGKNKSANIITVSYYNDTKQWGSYYHTLNYLDFDLNVRNIYGFKEQKNKI